MAKILVIDHSRTTAAALKECLSTHKVYISTDASSGIELANDINPDLVILELSLSGHSGMEFLYEFRTYTDWVDIPVIIYSTVRLEPLVLKSRVWDQLNVAAYMYKPDSTLELLKSSVEKYLSALVT